MHAAQWCSSMRRRRGDHATGARPSGRDCHHSNVQWRRTWSEPLIPQMRDDNSDSGDPLIQEAYQADVATFA